jgi:hypothetical protein
MKLDRKPSTFWASIVSFLACFLTIIYPQFLLHSVSQNRAIIWYNIWRERLRSFGWKNIHLVSTSRRDKPLYNRLCRTTLSGGKSWLSHRGKDVVCNGRVSSGAPEDDGQFSDQWFQCCHPASCSCSCYSSSTGTCRTGQAKDTQPFFQNRGGHDFCCCVSCCARWSRQTKWPSIG